MIAKKEGRISRTIQVPASLYEAVQALAHDRRISLNELIVQALQSQTKERKDAGKSDAGVSHTSIRERRGVHGG